LLVRDVRFGLMSGSVECVLESCSQKMSTADVLFGVADGYLSKIEASWDYLASLRLSAVPVLKFHGSPVSGVSSKNSNHLWFTDLSAGGKMGNRTFSIAVATATGRESREAISRVCRTASNINYVGKIVDDRLSFAASDLHCLVNLGVI